MFRFSWTRPGNKNVTTPLAGGNDELFYRTVEYVSNYLMKHGGIDSLLLQSGHSGAVIFKHYLSQHRFHI